MLTFSQSRQPFGRIVQTTLTHTCPERRCWVDFVILRIISCLFARDGRRHGERTRLIRHYSIIHLMTVTTKTSFLPSAFDFHSILFCISPPPRRNLSISCFLGGFVFSGVCSLKHWIERFSIYVLLFLSAWVRPFFFGSGGIIMIIDFWVCFFSLIFCDIKDWLGFFFGEYGSFFHFWLVWWLECSWFVCVLR
jgi:hypothetical protein